MDDSSLKPDNPIKSHKELGIQGASLNHSTKEELSSDVPLVNLSIQYLLNHQLPKESSLRYQNILDIYPHMTSDELQIFREAIYERCRQTISSPCQETQKTPSSAPQKDWSLWFRIRLLWYRIYYFLAC